MPRKYNKRVRRQYHTVNYSNNVNVSVRNLNIYDSSNVSCEPSAFRMVNGLMNIAASCSVPHYTYRNISTVFPEFKHSRGEDLIQRSEAFEPATHQSITDGQSDLHPDRSGAAYVNAHQVANSFQISSSYSSSGFESQLSQPQRGEVPTTQLLRHHAILPSTSRSQNCNPGSWANGFSAAAISFLDTSSSSDDDENEDFRLGRKY